MTVREKLKSLHVNVSVAEKARSEYIVRLREDGYTVRQLAGVLSVAPSTVMRWGPLPVDNGQAGRSLDVEA